MFVSALICIRKPQYAEQHDMKLNTVVQRALSNYLTHAE
jgi:hypothetical protein